MSDSVHKKVEVVGTSSDSVSKAIDIAVERASRTLRNLEWFEVVDIRGRIANSRVEQYQVTLKVGFKLD